MKYLILSLSLLAATAQAQHHKKMKDVPVVPAVDPVPPPPPAIPPVAPIAPVMPVAAIDSGIFDSTIVRKTDTTEIKVGNTRIIVIGDPKIERIEKIEKEDDGEYSESAREKAPEKQEEKGYKVDFDWFNFEFGLLSLQYFPTSSARVTQDRNLLEINREKSNYVNIRIVDARFPIIKKNISFRTGIGYEYNNYHFSNNVSLTPKVDTLGIVQETINFQKNKLLTKYFTLPLLVEFNSNPKRTKRNIYLAAGVEFGYFTGAKTKQISKERGKVKFNDDFNVQPYTLDAVAYAGYGPVSLFVKASWWNISQRYTSGLFRNDLLGTATPICFGIATNFNNN